MPSLQKGKFRIYLARSAGDVRRAQALRHLGFRGTPGLDADAHDDICQHYLIEDDTGALVGAFRLLVLTSGADIARSYSAQHYDLTRLAATPGPLLELGRFCLHPDHHDPDILRLAWAMMTGLVDRAGIALLFGCSSFKGTDPVPYHDAFAHLQARYLAPQALAPRQRAAEVVPLHPAPYDPRKALATLPPLLRTYLTMGGWVSDHAVVDHDLGTLHVFTGLDVARVPAGRARLLRASAG